MTPPQKPGQDDSGEQPDGQEGHEALAEQENQQQVEQPEGHEGEATPAGQDDQQEAEQSEGQAAAAEQVDQQEAGQSEGHAAAAEQENQQEAGQEEADQAAEADGTPAKKKRTGLIIGIAAAVLVVAGGAAAGYAYFAAGSAQSVAEDYAALSTRETQDPRSVTAENYRAFVCQQAMPQIEQMQQQKEEFLKVARPQDLELLKQVQTSVKSVQENGDSGNVALESTMPGQPPQPSNLKLTKEDGDWKLCA